MKRLHFLMAMLLICFNIHAQHSSKSMMKTANYALPGEEYGLGLTIPPIIFNDEPQFPEINTVEDDMSIELLEDSTGLTKLGCTDYYTVFYHYRLNSAEQLNKGFFTVKVSVTNQTDQVNHLLYKDTGTNTISGNFKIKYNYYYQNVKGRGWVKRYYRQPYSITATILGGFIPNDIITTLILDPDKDNNQVMSRYLSPLPPICPSHPHTE